MLQVHTCVIVAACIALATFSILAAPARNAIQKSEEAVVLPVAAQLVTRPTVSAPHLEKAPVIDGTVGADEWRHAARFTSFLGMKTIHQFRYETHGYIGWDDRAVYVAFQAHFIQGHPVTAQYGPEERDKPVFRDDSMELWLRPKDTNFCFMVNTLGSTADFRSQERFRWNGEWRTNVRTTELGYEGEMRIPFETLGASVPKPGDRWTFNLTRYQIRPVWTRGEFSFMGGKFTACHPLHAHLVFTRGITLRTDYIGKVRGNKIGVYGTLANTGADPLKLVLNYRIMKADDLGDFAFDAAGQKQLRYRPIEGATSKDVIEVAPGKTGTFAFFRACLPGKYLAGVRAENADGEVLLEQDVPCEIQLPLNVLVASKYLTRDAYGVRLVVGDVFDLPPDASAQFELLSEGKTLRKEECPIQNRQAEVDLDVKGIEPGEYSIRVSVLQKGAAKGSTEQALRIPPKPKWFTDPVGHTDEVLPPWTPVEVAGETVSVWGRDYLFGPDSPFPVQIRSQSRDLLAGVPRIVVKAGAETLSWRRGAIERKPHEARFVCSDEEGKLTAKAECTVGYEGLARVVLDIVPKEPVKIEEAYLEIPLNRKYVDLASVYHGKDVFRKKTPAVLAREGAVGPFAEAVTFNDMATGLEWLCSTPRSDWPVKNRKEMMEIRPDGETIRLLLKIVDKPVTLDRPIHMDNAFIAMPLRPKQRDPITWYFGLFSGNPDCKPEEFDEYINVHYPAHGNLDADGSTIELWLRVPAGKSPGQILSLKAGNAWIGVTGGEKVLSLSWFSGTGRRHSRKIGGIGWPAGEWAHLLLNWEGIGKQKTRVEAWLNGKRVGSAVVEVPAFGMYGARMFFGGVLGALKSDFDLDAIRISRGVADATEVARRGKTPPQRTDTTLLLDLFDTEIPVNSVAETTAEVISGRSGETGGIPHFLSKYVPGRHGKALSLLSKQMHRRIDILKRVGWRGYYLHNWGYDKWGYWNITDPEKARAYRHLAEESRKNDLVYMVYLCNFLSTLDKENYVFKAEMEKIPRMVLSESIMVNVKRPAQDFVVWQIKDIMERFGVTGLHLDFHAGYFPCRNEIAGNGWRDAAGMLHETWDYYDVWTQQKRIYTLCKKSPLKDGVIKIHAGPPMPWGDYRMQGEGSRVMEALLPLDRYRTGSTEGPTGVPKQFDAKYTHKDHNEMLAVTLLHNDPCRNTPNSLFVHYIRRPTLADPYSKRARPQTLLMSIRNKFGMVDAEFLPYWKPIPVRTDPDRLVTSLWRIKGKRTLAVVSNLKREPLEGAKVIFDLASLGLQEGEFAVFDAYTRVNLPIEGNVVTVDIDEANYRLIWLEKVAKGR